ncbi:MAG: LysM peptidoglycan-binding domain-containing protein [Nitrospinae bacterium]|nr:LysM peptidoglycan-binding domain-containing protein [Nitrospinota bacterium]
MLHDRDEMDIIFEVIDLDSPGRSYANGTRAAKSFVSARREVYRNALNQLYKNRGQPTNELERELAAKYERFSGFHHFKQAADRIRAQLGQANRFMEGVRRSGMYLATMKEIFRSYGLPEELTALPHVESSFNFEAYSSAGAAGVWQFMPGTGRLFMDINYTIDERRDPIIATHAAAKLLKANYEELGSWPLAITAYNHGRAGMARARQMVGGDIADIIENYRSRSFGFASKNFYCEFLAALDVARDYRRHFGDLDVYPEHSFEEVEIAHYTPATAVAQQIGIPLDTLREYNLALRSSVWKGWRHIPKGYRLRVPHGHGERGASAIASLPERYRLAEQASGGQHVVRRGETVGGIARAHGVSFRELMNANRLRSSMLRVGQRLDIPVRESRVAMASTSATARDTSTPVEAGAIHTVRRGDTLFNIARRNGIPLPTLLELNNLTTRSAIYPGQRLRVTPPEEPMAAVPATAVAPVEPSAPRKLERAAPASPEAKTAQDGEPQPVQVNEESITVMGRTLKVQASDYAAAPAGKNAGSIIVAAEETIGHYAEWAKISPSAIRNLNHRNVYRKMRTGAKITIPFTRVTREEFERKRLEYHLQMFEDFFESYQVGDEKQVTVAPGQSIWELCVNEHNAPLWLVQMYNPEKNLDQLNPGDSITIPAVVKK